MKNYLFLAVLLASIIFASCKKEEKQKQVSTAPIAVQTQAVDVVNSGDLRKTYIGQVESESPTSVSFTSSGTITRVCVNEGDHVNKGDLIAELDKTQCENMVATAEAQMTQANDAYDRMKTLHEKHSLPDMKWVEVQSQVEQAQTQLEAAKKMVEDCYLYSPVSGIVTTKQKNSGETALPSMPVVTITNIGQVKVKVNIPENEIVGIKDNTPSTITVDALSGRTYNGGSIDTEIQGDAMTHTYNVKINVGNGDQKLLPGMLCKVQFANAKSVGGISVPIRCVQQSANGQHFVWVAQNGKAHRQNVSLGNTYGNNIMITEGLASGDRVIIGGYQKVSEGTAIKEQ